MIKPSADILIASSGQLIGVHDKNREILWLSTRKKERFTSDRWYESFGYDDKEPMLWGQFEESVINEVENIRCDEFSCQIAISDLIVSVSSHKSTKEEDCAISDVIISSYPIKSKSCAAETIIDYYDLYYKGVHALYFDTETSSVQIDYVGAHRGDRPWVSSQHD